jgi:hypothetical protein
MEWYGFRDRHRRPHLVLGEYDPAEPFFRISHFGIVGRLVVALRPGGEWAMQRVSHSQWPAIYVAYERHADALPLAEAVGASPGSHTPLSDRWSSVYSYWLNRSLCSDMVAKTAALLEAQRTGGS